MKKNTLISEIMWEYNCTHTKAKEIVSMCESQGKYDDLCKVVIDKKPLTLVAKEFNVQ